MSVRREPFSLGASMNPENEVAHRRSLFERKIRKSRGKDCWEWIGAKGARGAGTFGLGALGGVRSAHVAAWVLYRDSAYNPDLPYTFYHLCGNNGCVNPEHLLVMGASGIANPQDVVAYLAQRHPPAKSHLLAAKEDLPSFVSG